MKKLSFFNRIVFYLNLIFSLALLLACIVPYTDSSSLAFFSLAVPALVMINLCFAVYWFLFKRWLVLLPLAICVYGYLTLGSFVSVSGALSETEQSSTIKLMTYNVLGFRGKEDNWQSTAGDSILRFVADEAPDIICFQEYDYMKMEKSSFHDYPYSAVDSEFGEIDTRLYQAIYAKHEIVGKGFIDFGNTYNSAVYADILYERDTLRIYSVHLQSLNIRPRDFKNERSDRLFARLRKSFEKQRRQADILRAHMEASPFKTIVAGDFNNSQFSSVYFNIKGDLKDTFIEKGNGYGGTINFWKFPFRIDFILTAPSFNVVAHQNYDINLSDHEPIMASIKVTSDE